MSDNECHKALLKGEDTGSFFEVVEHLYFENRNSDNELYKSLSELHNDSLLDLNKKFSSICRDLDGYDFFVMLQVYEKSLPNINCNVSDVIKCIGHLLKQAGNDLAIGGLYSAFIEFCRKDFQHSVQALPIIIRDFEIVSSLVSNTIVAASEDQFEWCILKINELVDHNEPSIRREIYSAIGRMTTNSQNDIERLISIIERKCEIEVEDIPKGAILRTSIALGNKQKLVWGRVSYIIDKVTDVPRLNLLYEASHIVAFEQSELPEDIKLKIIDILKNTPADYKGVLKNIDYLLVKLLKDSDFHTLEHLIETLICTDSQLEIESFGYFSREILNSFTDYFSRLVTKWFLSGQLPLCRAVHGIFQVSTGGKEANIVADIELVKPEHSTFIARKAIGWLYTRPVVAACFIFSMVGKFSKEIDQELEDLLYEPLLLSYTGELKGYIKNHETDNETDNETVIQISQNLMSRLDNYFEGLKEVSRIKELRSPDKNIDSYWSNFNRQMQKAKEKGPKGIFEQLCTVQHLLYGDSSITYVYDGSGTAHRSEIQMQTISHSSEMPRLNVIDPEGLDYMLRIFRVERMPDEINT